MSKQTDRERDREQFSSYVQSTAFSISMSRNMVVYLDDAIRRETQGTWKTVVRMHMGIYRSLETRGLVAWHRDSEGRNNGMYVTEAGYALHDLLHLAGLVEKRATREKAA